VVIVHGLKDHSGRYEHVASELARRAYAVHAFDLRGHGRSGGARHYVERFSEYVSDLEVLLARVRSTRRPVFVLAHSMGAVVACAASIDGRISPDGMVLTGAALLPGPSVSPLLVRSAALLGRYLPQAPVVRLDVEAISRDPEVVRRARNDPLTDHGPSPARTGSELLDAAGRVLEHAAEVGPQLLILHGGGDRLADPEGSRRLHEATRGRGAELTVYPNLYHEILNEPERERVMEDILDWLAQQT
jgi:acylglycerol lipase